MHARRNAAERLTSQVVLVIHDPRLQSAGGRRLHQVLGWTDPEALTRQFIEDMREVSHGCVDYQVVERIDAPDWPAKRDGFAYTEEEFLRCWRARSGFHEPDGIDYHSLVDELGLIERIDAGTGDEIWLFGFPYAGYYESIMAGPGAFWCNSQPLSGTERASRRFVIMGFNYERGVGEMLESYGHRAESIMGRVYAGVRGDVDLWERFTRYDLKYPGRAEVGNIHFAPNSRRDYDWGNPRYVPSLCDDWLHFPDFQGRVRQVNCAEWGGGDIRFHHQWWYRHLPHIEGRSDGISHNWWEYIVDPNQTD